MKGPDLKVGDLKKDPKVQSLKELLQSSRKPTIAALEVKKEGKVSLGTCHCSA